MKAKTILSADDYFRELEAWSQRKQSAKQERRRSVGVVIDFLAAKKLRRHGLGSEPARLVK